MRDRSSQRETLKMLYETYSNDVYRYAFATLGDSSEAHDVVQEVFIRAYRAINNFRHDATAKTWIMTIARNYIFDVLRKQRKDRQFLSQSELPDIGDEATDVSVVLEVEEALQELKDDYRQVVSLRYIDNLSIKETASVLGWSEKKVQNAAHRAILQLREVLGSDFEEVKRINEIRT
ncbi:RNA polymerase sigma factor [Alicyclobacillus ferrooxydans]|uniref:RNA polymerase subunit sigma-24 n=1 Tax=Alicyclobacillus ferrooxydans TaxID=471514 RepID=A0A0P9GPI4_9BACL|nr:RNA polymerase sigma factor [Alicyclobacillus ferrooxydans]KPV42554.1 hypothetical protein AN477_17105 [Alicyclobacillus ferrooxydans]